MAEVGKNDNSLILGVNSLQNRPLCRCRGHRWRVRDKARPRKAARISVQECFAEFFSHQDRTLRGENSFIALM
jgi:hypothetical protein